MSTPWYLSSKNLPSLIQCNHGVQHVFHNDFTLEARYLGTRGVHLIVQNRLNIQSKVDPTHFLPTYFAAPSQATLDGLSTTLTQIQARSSLFPAYADAGFNGSNIVGFIPLGDSR